MQIHPMGSTKTKLSLLVLSIVLASSIAWFVSRYFAGPRPEVLAPLSPVPSTSFAAVEGEATTIETPMPANVPTGSNDEADARVAVAGAPPPPAMPETERQRFVEDVRAQIRREAYLKELAVAKGWDVQFKDYPASALEAKFEEVKKSITESTDTWFDERFAAGDCEVSNEMPAYVRDTVYRVAMERGGPYRKVTLPKEQFPQIYEQKDLQDWLYMESHRRPAGH